MRKILSSILIFSIFIIPCLSSCIKDEDKLELVIDTDVGADCDDMLALAYAIYAEESLNVDLKAITYSNGAEYGIAAIKAIYKDLNKAAPPIGAPSQKMKSYDSYCKKIAENFEVFGDTGEEKDSVAVLREALVKSEKLTICALGAFTNISALLNSAPDEISELTGEELVRQKCEKIVVMAGKFENAENQIPGWNISLDIEAGQNVIHNFPAPLFFITHEIGYNLITGKPLMDKYQNDNPVSMSYMLYPGVIEAGGRHSWDPLAVFFAVEGEKDIFTVGEEIGVTVNDDGRTYMNENKNARYVVYFKTLNGSDELSKESAASYIDSCVLALYDRRGENK